MFAWFLKYRESFLITLGLLVSGAVAYVTGASSWGHIVHVGRTVAEPSAAWLPVAIDGMMINGTVMAAVDKFRKKVPRFWAVVSLWLGSALTLAFNAASALARGPWAVVIACMYAVALLVTVETIFHPSQRWLKAVLIERAATVPTPEPEKPISEPVVTVPVTPAPAPATNGHDGRQRPRKGTHKPKPQGPRRAPARTSFTGSAHTDEDIERALTELRERPAQAHAIEAVPLFREPVEVGDSDPIDAELVD